MVVKLFNIIRRYQKYIKVSRKKSKVILVRVNDEVFHSLLRKCEEAGVTISFYVRSLLTLAFLGLLPSPEDVASGNFENKVPEDFEIPVNVRVEGQRKKNLGLRIKARSIIARSGDVIEMYDRVLNNMKRVQQPSIQMWNRIAELKDEARKLIDEISKIIDKLDDRELRDTLMEHTRKLFEIMSNGRR